MLIPKLIAELIAAAVVLIAAAAVLTILKMVDAAMAIARIAAPEVAP